MTDKNFSNAEDFVALWVYELARRWEKVDHWEGLEKQFAVSLIKEIDVDPAVVAECFESSSRIMQRMADAARRVDFD